MAFPDWYDSIPPLVLYDPLAERLGAAEGGLIDYRYADAVRLAGHSCPTVACAWLMATRGMTALWPVGHPERGATRVEFRDPRDEGTTGVTAAVFMLVTGAADLAGFKGLGGNFDRRLASFGAGVPGSVRLTRLDNGKAVDLSCDAGQVPPEPRMQGALRAMLDGTASQGTLAEFARLWQDRTRRILESPERVLSVRAV
jgi:hypothetical protein